MVPVPSYQNLPTFGGGATLVQPIAGTYNGGFLPGQLFPAEYENWLMNFITANSNTSQTSVLSMNAELVNILTAASITPIPATNTQLKTALDALYVKLTGATMTGILNMGSNKITNLSNPSDAQDAATKTYVDTNFAALGGATFTGPVVVPVASGSTSPPQKTYVDSQDSALQTQISANALLTGPLTVQAFSGAFNATDTISAMSIGETRLVNVRRTESASGSYALVLPATGSFTYELLAGSWYTGTSAGQSPLGASACTALTGVSGGSTMFSTAASFNPGILMIQAIVRRDS